MAFNSSSESFIVRKAFDSSGCTGSFYDGQRDQILDQPHISYCTPSYSFEKKVTCCVKKCKMDEPPNLLESFDIHSELRLSVALQMAPATGMGTLINYSRPFNKYTRLLHYTRHTRTDYFSDNQINYLRSITLPIRDVPATHIIRLVNWGIDCAIVLQLPPEDELVQEFPPIIDKLCTSLGDSQDISLMTQTELSFLEKIVHMEVFSNISDLCRINSIVGLHHEISRIKYDTSLHKPYNYHLYSIQNFNGINYRTKNVFRELQEKSIQKVEYYLLHLLTEFRRLTAVLNQDYPNLQQYLKEYLYKMRAKWPALKTMYTDRIKSLQELVVGIRSGKDGENKIDEELCSQETQNSTKTIKDLSADVTTMKKKEDLIKDLLEKQFQYKNASEYDIQQNDDDDAILEQKLLKDGKHERIVCFNDDFYEKEKSQWYTLQGQLIKELNETSQLRVVYVDFSHCSYKLKHMIVLPSVKKKDNLEAKNSSASPSSIQLRRYNSINILLLGESGAGKSTFINAFANYLVFDKLEEAQEKPTVLIPVSFIMTVGDDFQERHVTFGGMDTLSNEVHDHSSQSVTQHCKSYVFTLKENENKKERLRIIDTPGIGDVRGTGQDDINMQHILSYINNLTHLDAVCILMKPNNARLNIFFRSCLVQLLDLLGENARDRIIFCFTNARATFYTPGNTGPLLKQLLKSLPVQDIPFNKTNTFCFDSESFRYLVAKQNEIKFGEPEEKDYKDSWERSSNESKRFIAYIRTYVTNSHIFGERESMKDAQLKVSLLIRPILEAIRNTLRNTVLWEANFTTTSIKLCPRIVKCTTAICLACSREAVKYGNFWITKDELHVFHNKCRTCQCSPDNHYPIDYQLEYELCHHPANNSSDDLITTRRDLRQASAELAHFLVTATDTSQNDLFLAGFDRMIKEEGNICKSKTPCQLNKELLEYLTEQKDRYEDIKKGLLAKNKDIDLSKIYGRIRDLNNYPAIKSQMTTVEEWRKFMIRYYEYEVRS